ncbi:MAG: DUF1292 domain-containing protein [Clostridia bacterium]|nr:DUF1292 domain-containing protein [Clostridia bacterium]
MDNENLNNPEELEDFDELDNIIVLNDEEGNEVEFEFLDVVELDGKEYVVLLPVEEADAGEVVIFRVEGEEEDESYIGVEDDEEAEKVFKAFKEKTKDTFNFVDED